MKQGKFAVRTMFLAAFISLCGLCQTADAQRTLNITVENPQNPGGFYFTPLWVGFHDGSFDYFDAGDFASSSLEAVAEGGDLSGIRGDFMGVAGGQDGVIFGDSMGPPPFDPTESVSALFNVNQSNRYFSYSSMFIPTNDAFFGNDNAMGVELFDAAGAFLGPQTIEITVADLYDAGTEVNDINGGAAFSANGGMSTDEMNAIGMHSLADLNNFFGSETNAGTFITETLASDTVIARISIAVPEPSSMGILGVVAALGIVRRRRSA